MFINVYLTEQLHKVKYLVTNSTISTISKKIYRDKGGGWDNEGNGF
jgi:hypothetical protein